MKNMEEFEVVEEDMEEFEVVERDPTGQYGRYREVIGKGASKIVYKGFDVSGAREVAWSKVKLTSEMMSGCEKKLKRLLDEGKLLQSLKHPNVMKCYHSWVDSENNTINMITELFTSGDLSQYCKKHQRVDIRAIKNWSRQILRGLDYLHRHDPPIMHRDIKCENIYVHGNSSKVKIGDLGVATVMEHSRAHSFTGTPVFMAPELYDDDYNQLADIYSFGMCVLQMITRENPYAECKTVPEFHRKVTTGVKPLALQKVTDLQAKQFIVKCLAPVSARPAAVDLLQDPFLASGDSVKATLSQEPDSRGCDQKHQSTVHHQTTSASCQDNQHRKQNQERDRKHDSARGRKRKGSNYLSKLLPHCGNWQHLVV